MTESTALSGRPEVALSCVVDDTPEIRSSFVPWLATAVELARIPPSRIHVHHVGALSAEIVELCDTLEVRTYRIEPFDRRYPHTNKIRQCATPLAGVRRVVLTDVDVAFAGLPPFDRIRTPVAGKLVDRQNPPLKVLRKVFRAAGVAAPGTCKSEYVNARDTLVQFNTLPGNYNGGLYVMDAEQLNRIGEAWAFWGRWLIAHIGLLDRWATHVDQVSFCLAVNDLRIPAGLLDEAWNFPLHLPVADSGLEPFILHHHAQLDGRRRLKQVSAPGPRQAIERVNGAIESFERKHLAGSPGARAVQRADGVLLRAWQALCASGRRDGFAATEIGPDGLAPGTRSRVGVSHSPAVRSGRHCILVAGMHRSGTSALTRVLNLSGADLASDLMRPLPANNEKGFWESVHVRALHDGVLSDMGSRWDDLSPVPESWFGSAGAAALARGLADYLHAEFSTSELFVIKDPRICLFLPVWSDVLNELQVCRHVLMPLRHPIEVAESLHARDGFPQDKGLLLWLKYFLAAEAGSRGMSRAFCRYDALLSDWRTALGGIAAELALELPLPDGAAARVGEFLDMSLRHFVAADRPSSFGEGELALWTQTAWEAALALSERRNQEAALRQLDDTRRSHCRAANAFGPVIRDMAASIRKLRSANSKLRRDYTDISEEAVKLRETNRELREGSRQRKRARNVKGD